MKKINVIFTCRIWLLGSVYMHSFVFHLTFEETVWNLTETQTESQSFISQRDQELLWPRTRLYQYENLQIDK